MLLYYSLVSNVLLACYYQRCPSRCNNKSTPLILQQRRTPRKNFNIADTPSRIIREHGHPGLSVRLSLHHPAAVTDDPGAPPAGPEVRRLPAALDGGDARGGRRGGVDGPQKGPFMRQRLFRHFRSTGGSGGTERDGVPLYRTGV